jgi:hypothetical protein
MGLLIRGSRKPGAQPPAPRTAISCSFRLYLALSAALDMKSAHKKLRVRILRTVNANQISPALDRLLRNWSPTGAGCDLVNDGMLITRLGASGVT